MLTLEDLIIRPDATLREALERMTRNHKGVVFVCDRDVHLAGVVADGDIRRTVLDNTLLVAPVGKVMNTDPIVGGSVEEAEALLRQHSAVAVPVVTAEGRVSAIVMSDGAETRVLRGLSEPGEEWEEAEGLGAVAIIPARGGSKRVPRKNLATVGGRPLLAWAIAAAHEAREVSHVIVSTDDPEIARVAKTWGAEVPWLRPAELAQDTTPSIDVVVHALEWAVAELEPAPRFGVLLEPTAPLRTGEQIDVTLRRLARDPGADSAMTVAELPHLFNPEELLVVDGDEVRPYVAGRTLDTRRLRGQQSPVYVQNGLAYAFRTGTVLEQRSLYGRRALPVITGWEYFLDVDTPEDLQGADARLMMLRPTV